MRIRNALALSALALLLAGTANSVWGEGEMHGASRVVPIEGSDLRQVILSDHAAARLGILTDVVSGRDISRSHRIPGETMALPYPEALMALFEGEGQMPGAVIRATRTMAAQSMTLGQSAAIHLTGKSGQSEDLTARLIAIVPAETPDGSDDLFFALDGADPGLGPQRQVLVEFTTTELQRKAVQSTALMYDSGGATWVFVSPEPLVYTRQQVEVDFIHLDMAVLTQGPTDGTLVVTGGAMLLLGTEYGIGH